MNYRVLSFLFAGMYAWPLAGQTLLSASLFHRGACSASAGVAVDAGRFLAGDDEGNTLRVYANDRNGAPAQSFELSRLLKLKPKNAELDIEGAARLGDLIFWITSHSPGKDGKVRRSREYLFATRLDTVRDRMQLTIVGRPYRRLIEEMAGDPRLAQFRLAEAATLPAKSDGALNIEGLCATADGHLLIGFRSPIPGGRALVVPLLNPRGLLDGKRARWGDPLLLDLDGLGVRDLAFAEGRHLILAGPASGHHGTGLYLWDGTRAKSQRVLDANFHGLNPEAIIVYPGLGTARFQILSDDGNHKPGIKSCDEQGDSAAKFFRSVWVAFDGNAMPKR